MPKVFEWRGFRFHFYSYEGNPREPVHIYVAKAGAEAKFWLYPEVRLVSSSNLTPLEIRRLEKVIKDKRQLIGEAWNEHFSD